MVRARKQQLERILRLRKQQARMVELEQQRVDALLNESVASIERLRQEVSEPAPTLPLHELLASRSAWLQHTCDQIAKLQNELNALEEQRAEITARRQHLERQAEAMSGFVAEQNKILKQQQQRADDARLCDFIAQQSSGSINR